jgi:CheY-specific phosphatase CheX
MVLAADAQVGTQIALQRRGPQLRAEDVEPLLAALFDVLEELAKARCERGPLIVWQHRPFITRECTFVLELKGPQEALCLYTFSAETALKLAAAIMGRETVQLDDAALGALSQFAAAVAQKATDLLQAAGLTWQITPPRLVRGVGLEVGIAALTLVVPVSTEIGKLDIAIFFGLEQ